MKKRIIILMLIIPLFLFMSCPPEKNESIELEIYETYCTSIELKITMMDSLKEKEYSVKRNDSLIATGTMTDNQIIITDENLEPNTQYTYKAYSKNDESELVTAITMDTTSHDFVWDIDTLGNYGSILRDVAIIDENNIWVVGEIRTDSTNYNAAHWDGEEWELKRILYKGGFWSINSIHVFSENDIWFDPWVHWDGNKFNEQPIPDILMGYSINSIWGTSSSNMYFVGDNGSIVHYDGSDFEKIESGTEVDLLDIDGTDDGKYIIITGYENSGELSGQSVVLEIRNGKCNTIFSSTSGYGDIENGDYGRFWTIEIFGKKAYFTTGATDLLIYDYISQQTKYYPKSSTGINGLQLKYMDGNNSGDIAFSSVSYEIIHYNGSTYKTDNYLKEYFLPGRFRPWCLSFKGDIICIGGEINVNEHGLIAIGKR